MNPLLFDSYFLRAAIREELAVDRFHKIDTCYDPK